MRGCSGRRRRRLCAAGRPPLAFDRRATVGLGARSSSTVRTYQDRERSYLEAQWHRCQDEPWPRGLRRRVGSDHPRPSSPGLAGGGGSGLRPFPRFPGRDEKDSRRCPGPGQELAIEAIGLVQLLKAQGNIIIVRWVPTHQGIEGYEQADRRAKEAAASRAPTARRYSLTFLRRTATERVTPPSLTLSFPLSLSLSSPLSPSLSSPSPSLPISPSKGNILRQISRLGGRPPKRECRH